MSAAVFLASYVDAVTLVALMQESGTLEGARSLYRKTLAAHLEVHGPERAREVARQVEVLLDGLPEEAEA